MELPFIRRRLFNPEDPAPESRCSNCSTTKTSGWRVDFVGNLLCNECGLYYRQHGIYRPLDQEASQSGDEEETIAADKAMIATTKSNVQNELVEDEGLTRCSSCSTTKPTVWNILPNGSILCNACNLWKHSVVEAVAPVSKEETAPVGEEEKKTMDNAMIAQISTTLTSVQSELATLCAKLTTETKLSHADSAKEITELKMELASLRVELKAAHTARDNLKLKTDAEISRLSNAEKAASKKVENFRIEVRVLNKKRNCLADEAASFKDKLNEFKTKEASFHSEVRDLRKVVVEADRQCSVAKEEAAKLKAINEHLAREAADWAANNASMEKEIAALKQIIERDAAHCASVFTDVDDKEALYNKKCETLDECDAVQEEKEESEGEAEFELIDAGSTGSLEQLVNDAQL